VKRARAIAPGIQTGILTSSYLLDPVAALRSAGARDYWQSEELVDQSLVDRIHEAGGRVIVWTVNDATTAEALRTVGVDGICSDDLRVVAPRSTTTP
jgi:glycerophosphoryl diester phosphodiesterase